MILNVRFGHAQNHGNLVGEKRLRVMPGAAEGTLKGGRGDHSRTTLGIARLHNLALAG